MAEPRIACAECGEELWTVAEAGGLCCNCRELQNDGDLDAPLDLEDQLDATLAEADEHFEAFYDATTEGPLQHKGDPRPAGESK